MELHFVHSEKKQVVKLFEIHWCCLSGEMFWPRNDDRKLLHCYGQQLWFNYLPGSLINNCSLSIRRPRFLTIVELAKTFDLLIQVLRDCYNNVCN